jgi:hypothetical protein
MTCWLLKKDAAPWIISVSTKDSRSGGWIGVSSFPISYETVFFLQKYLALALNDVKTDTIVGLDPKPACTLHVFIACL